MIQNRIILKEEKEIKNIFDLISANKENLYVEKIENTIEFLTHDIPQQTYAEIATRFPNVDFTAEYADEEVGVDCGLFVHTAPESTLETWVPEDHNKAIEFACKVIFDYDPSKCGFKKDSNRNWVYDENADKNEDCIFNKKYLI